MNGVRIAGIPATPGRLDRLLRQWFGYEPVEQDGEWLIRDTDRALRRGPKNVVSMHGQIVLEPQSFGKAATILADSVPAEFDRFRQNALQDLPNQIPVAGGLGLATELRKRLIELTILPRDNLSRFIERELLPFLYHELELRFAVPISVDSALLQSYFSIAKLAFLTAQFGEEEARRLTLDRDAFGAIEMSGGIDVLSFIDCLTRFAPIAFTMPVRRHGSSWHFYRDGMQLFQYDHLTGIFQTPQFSMSPRYTQTGLHSLMGVYNFNESNIWRLLRVVVSGLNNLFRFLNDHRNFVRSDGSIDFLRQLQAYAAVYLLFSDLLHVVSWIEPHSRITFAFAFLDKLANMRKHLGDVQGSEAEISSNLAALEQGKEVKRLISRTVAPGYPELAPVLENVVGRCYWRLHRRLGEQCSRVHPSEAERLSRFRQSRNLAHGAYLNRDQFEQVFAKSSGSMPEELSSLPYVLAMALLLNPDEFLRFSP